MLLESKEGPAFKGHYGIELELDFKEVVNAEGHFEGYGSTFNNVDRGRDIVMPGAFTKSLQKRPASKVKMLRQHSVLALCGVWDAMSEDSKGLNVKGHFLLSTQLGKETYELTRAGALDGLSIGYRTITEEFDRVQGTRKLIEVDLYEVSVVTFGMNDKATIQGVKGFTDLSPQEVRDLEAALRDEGLSRADAVKAVAGFKNWLLRDAGAPDQGPRDEVSPDHMAAVEAAFQGLAARIRA